MEVVIQRETDLAVFALEPLVAESEQMGWRFVRRLVDDFQSGANRFDQPGESLFVARCGEAVVGVCGLNVDPYGGEPTVGRVRRLYVLQAYRNSGVGRRLVQAVVTAAAGHFQRLRVRTKNPDAGRLYERLGFQPTVDEKDSTHFLDLSADGSG